MSRMLPWSMLLVLLLGAVGAWADTATTFLPEAPTMLIFGTAGIVPLRPMVELTGAKMIVSGKKITVTRGAHTVVFTIDHPTAWQDGNKITLPTPPTVFTGLTYVPVRSLVTALGGSLDVGRADAILAIFPGMDPLPLPAIYFTAPSLKTYQKYDSELYLARLDGGGVRQLTYNIMDDESPHFAPERAEIFYTRLYSPVDVEEGRGVATIMRRVGNDPVAVDLTATARKAGKSSAWPISTADDTVLFAQYEQPFYGNKEIPNLCRMGADGSGFAQLCKGVVPLISADGTYIIYAGLQKDTDEIPCIHMMRRDGSDDHVVGKGIPMAVNQHDGTLVYITPPKTQNEVTRLTAIDPTTCHEKFQTEENDTMGEGPYCDFSPDGTKLVYVRENHGVWIADADHTHVRQLTSSPYDAFPKFSPNGSSIAFIREGMLYTMHLDGSVVTCLSANVLINPVNRITPPFDFSPDGSAIIFSGLTEKAAVTRSYLYAE